MIEPFEFQDFWGREYRCQPWGESDAWWLFYKHHDGQWVSLRKISDAELDYYLLFSKGEENE